MESNRSESTTSLSSFHRSDTYKEAASQSFDLLVIGGGITGAGIALDAVTRGMRTLVIDKQDFGAGTSSRSTKLIHGGLRYLKQLEFLLVAEVGRERAIVYRNAPHVVVPEQLLLPLVKGGTYGKLASSFGLWAYDLLAGVSADEKRVMLSKAKALEEEPMLREDILTGAGLYWEYRTDDARLVMEVLKTAVNHGALALNYAAAEDFVYENGKICGAKIKDTLTGKVIEVRAKETINAAGPWVDKVRQTDEEVSGKRLHHTKGVHIVVDHARLPLKHAVYFDVPGGRMVFAIPRGKCTYIGTTDTNFDKVLESPEVTRKDVDYLLQGANQIFPKAKLSVQDIRSSWAGIRPLIHEDGKAPSELSRKDEIFYSKQGLVSIAGGKLTGYRKMAEKAVDVVMKRLHKSDGRKFEKCTTDTVTLAGGNLDGRAGVKTLMQNLISNYGTDSIDSNEIEGLVNRYGTEAEHILEKYLPGSENLLLAELKYCLHQEAVSKPGDFFTRRTGMLFFNRQRVQEVLPMIIKEMADALNWSEREIEKYQQEFIEEWTSALRFE